MCRPGPENPRGAKCTSRLTCFFKEGRGPGDQNWRALLRQTAAIRLETSGRGVIVRDV